MILLADSGGTKTEWWGLDGIEKIFTISTTGLNPNFCSNAELEEVIKYLFSYLPESVKIESIFFYGAGCGSSENVNRLVEVISKVFGDSVYVEISTDLLGVARAVSNKHESIACILGTGSNACVANGKEIVHQIPSWGYIFGDFGSGCDMGKRTLQFYFEKSLPGYLQKSFIDWISLSDVEILNCLYKKPRPNKFLAGISKFHSEFIADEFLFSLRQSCFRDFFIRQIQQLPNSANLPLNFFGSISWYFQDDIRIAAEKSGFTVSGFHRNPMEGLLNFHTNIL